MDGGVIWLVGSVATATINVVYNKWTRAVLNNIDGNLALDIALDIATAKEIVDRAAVHIDYHIAALAGKRGVDNHRLGSIDIDFCGIQFFARLLGINQCVSAWVGYIGQGVLPQLFACGNLADAGRHGDGTFAAAENIVGDATEDIEGDAAEEVALLAAGIDVLVGGIVTCEFDGFLAYKYGAGVAADKFLNYNCIALCVVLIGRMRSFCRTILVTAVGI